MRDSNAKSVMKLNSLKFGFLILILVSLVTACGKVDRDKKNYIACSREIIEFSNTIDPNSDSYLEKMKAKVMERCKLYGFQGIIELKAAYKKYSDHSDPKLLEILQQIEHSPPKEIQKEEEPAKKITQDKDSEEQTSIKAENEKSFLTGCERGDKGRVLYLLDKDVDINARDKETGKTGLHYAVESMSIDVIKLLLEKGADPNIRTKNGLTPILLNAVINSEIRKGRDDDKIINHIKIIVLLLRAGADVNDRKVPEGLNVFACYILYSAGSDNLYQFDKKIATYLLEKEADVNAKTKKDMEVYLGDFIPEGSTILDIMTVMGNTEKVNFLKQHGAKHGTWAKYYLDRKEKKEAADDLTARIKPIDKEIQPEPENKKSDKRDADRENRKKSPAYVVAAAYMTGNQGYYSETEKYFHSDALLTIIASKGAHALRKIWDEATRNGNVEKIEILNESIRGERADVYFKIHFKDGKAKVDKELLMKEGHYWKIAFND